MLNDNFYSVFKTFPFASGSILVTHITESQINMENNIQLSINIHLAIYNKINPQQASSS